MQAPVCASPGVESQHEQAAYNLRDDAQGAVVIGENQADVDASDAMDHAVCADAVAASPPMPASSRLEPAVRNPGVRMHSTPDVLRSLAPAGAQLGLDIPGCRFRAKVNGTSIGQIAFGPNSPHTRLSALEEILNRMWRHSKQTRPSECYVSSLPSEIRENLLADRLERPRKYPRL